MSSYWTRINQIKVLFIVILVVIIALTSCTSSTSKPAEPMQVISDLTSNKMMGRLPGTEGNVIASEYIEKQFELIGLQPFNANSFKQAYQQQFFDPSKQEYMMKVSLDDGTSKEFKYGQDYMEQLINFNFNLEALITFDIDDANLDEKILVLDDIQRYDMTKQQIRPQAILIARENFKKILPTESKKTPFYQINPDTYQWLYTHSDQIQKMKLTMELEQGPIQVNNIVGVIPGKQSQDHRHAVVISAHLDHVGWNEGNKDEIYRGAVDNASGVAALLKVASSLYDESSKQPLQSDLIIAAFNGEESHFQGSTNFVEHLGSKYDHVFNINLDCLGVVDGGKVLLVGQENDVLVNSMLDFFNEKGLPAVQGNAISSDHLLFVDRGFPALTVTQEKYNFIHTTLDTVEKIDEDMLNQMITLVYQYVVVYEPKLDELQHVVHEEKLSPLSMSPEELKEFEEMNKKAEQERTKMKLGQYMRSGTKEKPFIVTKYSENYSQVEQMQKDFKEMNVLPSLAEYTFHSANVLIRWDDTKMKDLKDGEFDKKYQTKFNTQDINYLNLIYRNKEDKGIKITINKDKINYIEGEEVTTSTKTYDGQEYTVALIDNKNALLYTSIKIKDTTYYIEVFGGEFVTYDVNGTKEESFNLDWLSDDIDQHIKFTHDLPWTELITDLGI